jgi:hypothetical protein
MKFVNAEGQLELRINGYQLDEGEHGDGFNCLNVDGVVQHQRGDWQFRAKFCSIGHLTTLADWLMAVANGQTPDAVHVGGFMCHALAFAVFGSRLRPELGLELEVLPAVAGNLRVTFGCDTQPPWDNLQWVSMDFALADSDLRAMAAELREQLRAHAAR